MQLSGLQTNKLKPNGAGEPILIQKDTVFTEDGIHSLRVGATGSGKSVNLKNSIIYQLYLKKNDIVAVINEDDYRSIGFFALKYGYSTHCINFNNILYGESFNPLSYIANLLHSADIEIRDAGERLAYMLAEILINVYLKTNNDIFWPLQAKKFVCAIISLVCMVKDRNYANLVSVMRIIQEYNGLVSAGKSSFGEMKVKFYQRLFDLIPNNEFYIKSTLKEMAEGPRETVGSVAMSAEDPTMEVMFSSLLSRFICGIEDEFSISDIDIKKKNITFIVLPEDGSRVTIPLLETLISEMRIHYLRNLKKVNKEKLVHFYIDEIYTTIPTLPLDVWLSDDRKSNIRYHLSAQDIHQLTVRYGTDEAKIILDNIGSLFIFKVDGTDGDLQLLTSKAGSHPFSFRKGDIVDIPNVSCNMIRSLLPGEFYYMDSTTVMKSYLPMAPKYATDTKFEEIKMIKRSLAGKVLPDFTPEAFIKQVEESFKARANKSTYYYEGITPENRSLLSNIEDTITKYFQKNPIVVDSIDERKTDTSSVKCGVKFTFSPVTDRSLLKSLSDDLVSKELFPSAIIAKQILKKGSVSFYNYELQEATKFYSVLRTKSIKITKEKIEED